MNGMNKWLAAAAATALVASACSRKAPEGVLAYIPADTPYAIVNLEPVPKPVIEHWRTRLEPVGAAYEKALARAVAKLGDETTPEARAARAVLEELKGQMSFEGAERLGFDLDGHWAMYGIGLVPVVRAPLEDPAAFRAFVARVEQRYGEKLPGAKLGDQDYWRVGKSDAGLTGLLAVTKTHAIVSLVPANASDALVRQLLGVDLPKSSLEDTDALEKINAAHDFVPYGTGFFDTVRLATLLLDRKTGIEREFLAALKVEDEPVDPVCRAEWLGIAANFPRAVFGYTRFDTDAVDQTMLVETRPDIAAQLKAIAAPVPGLGGSGTGLFDFGMSLRVDQLKSMVDTHADAVAAKPYACASLASLNKGFADLKTQLANPVTFALAPVLHGFRVSMTGFTPVEGGTPEMTGQLVIASPNPQSLLASARTFLPTLAELRVEAGAAPIPVPADAAPPGTPPLHVATSATALGISVGAGEEAKLAAQLAAAPGAPPPLVAFGYGGTFLVRMMEFADTAVPETDAEAREEMEESMQMMKTVYGELFDRLDASLVATDRGIELRQGARFK